MCNFLSAIYLRTGKLICQPVYTDSHSELLEANGITERNTDAPVQQFVRLELTLPEKDEDWLEVAEWKENVDEHEVPEWFDKAARFDAFEQMREIIASAITDGDGRLAFGKLMIVRTGRVRCKGSRVFAGDGSNVTAGDGSNVTAWAGSNVTAWAGSKVAAWAGSNVTAWAGSNVTAWAGSNVTAGAGSKVTAV